MRGTFRLAPMLAALLLAGCGDDVLNGAPVCNTAIGEELIDGVCDCPPGTEFVNGVCDPLCDSLRERNPEGVCVCRPGYEEVAGVCEPNWTVMDWMKFCPVTTTVVSSPTEMELGEKRLITGAKKKKS